MASINKLSVRGIRAFRPDDEEQCIEFFYPCTIILGQNGCGKTTIIEAIKFAITGALPPGSKSGSSFVHDPKSIGHTTVKANIKLRFTSRANQTMVVVRSMEVTQRKIKATFKQLDGVLRTIDPETGERVSLSHKCGELDKQIPSLLGVSKAILEHVVFCHQEDASWPLQESAALKKRFDDIFDSTKYSKALKAFRDTEKEYVGKAKNLEVDVASISSHRHAAKGFRAELQEQHDRIDVLTEHKKTIDKDVAGLVQEIEAARATLDQLEEANGVIDAKSIELDQEERLVEEKRRLVEQDLSSKGMEALTGELQDFDQNMQEEVQRYKELERKAQSLQRRIEELHAEEQTQSSHFGKLQAEQEAHDTKLRERFHKMERIARDYKLDLTQMTTQSQANTSIAASLSQSMIMNDDESVDMTVLTITEDDMQGFLEGLQAKADELTADVNAHKARAREEEGNLQSVINELSSKIQTEQNTKQQLGAERVQSEQQIRALKESIGSSRMRKTEVEDYRRQAVQAAKERDQAVNNPRHNEIQTEIRHFERKMDDTKRAIEDETAIVERLKSTVATQNTIATLQEQCSKEIDALEETIKDEAFSVSKFGLQAPDALPRDQDENGEAIGGVMAGMEKSARSKLSEASTQLKATEETFIDAQRGVSEITATLHASQKAQTAARTKLQALSQTADAFKKTVEELQSYGASVNAPFEGNAEDPNALMRHLDKQIESVEALLITDAPKLAKKIAKKLAREMQNKSVGKNNKVACPCCKKSITEEELDGFLEELYDMTRQTVPQQSNDIAEQKKAKNTYLAFRKTIESQKDTLRDVSRLRQELATHEKESKRLQDELTRLHDEHKKCQQDKASAQSNEQDLRALLESIRRWNSDADRIASNKQLIIQKKQALAASGYNSDRDLNAVEKKVAQLREEKDNFGIEVSRLQKEAADLFAQRDRLVVRSSEIEKEANDKEKKFENERLAIQKKAELTERIKEILQKESEISERLGLLEQKDRKKKAELDRTRELFSGEQETLSAKLSGFTGHKRDIENISKEIERFERSSKSTELENMEAKRTKILESRKKKKKEYDELKPQLDLLTKAVDDQERYKKMLEENISILQSVGRIKELSDEIRELESQREGIGGPDDLGKHDALVAERDSLLQKKARTDGLFSSHMEQIRSLKRKLMSAEYKDVDEEYRVAKIKHSTTKLAAQDLKKYGNALDKALLQFHGVKIKEINKIVKELWMMCYRGQDITNIEIQSGQEEGSTASKSYNYRIVMTKGGAKMDMRGRCSAGQRVLTSIVIRLALAETFGLNCGCIALDEPTVNLDERNKLGLAVSLAHIIESRARQRNFQLLLITHDEDFIKKLKLELMTMTGFSMPESYFYVCREMANDGKFYSKIKTLGWEEL